MKNKTAVFFGKFQPPHLGHVITIKRILQDFKKLIVGITYTDKNGLGPNKIKKIFEDTFKNEKNMTFEIIEAL